MYFKKPLILLLWLLAVNLGTCAIAIADNMKDAQQAIEKKDYSAAIIHLKNQLKKSPKDIQARFLLGKTYFDSGNLNSSIKELGRAHDLSHSDTDILFLYVEALSLAGKHNKILKILKIPLVDQQLEIKRLSYMGNAKLSLKKINDAKTLFEQSLQLNENAMAYNGLATLAILEQDFPLAERILEKSQDIDKENSATLQLKAKFANIKNQPEEALALYNKLIKNNPNILSLYLERAATLASLKKNQRAKTDIDFVLKKTKNHPHANFILAQILLREQDFSGAQEAAQQVVNVIPQHMPATLVLGTANFALKNYHQAEEYLTIYLAGNPSDLNAQNLLANIYLENNKYQKVILILEDIPAEARNSNPYILQTLGNTYIQMGNNEKGIELLSLAQSLAPNDSDIRKSLISAQFQANDLDEVINEIKPLSTTTTTEVQEKYLLILSYIKQHQLDKAEKNIRQLLIQSPNDIKLKNFQALILQLRGKTAQAITQYQSIIEQDKEDISAYMGLARIYAIQKKWQQAENYYQQVIQINPATLNAYLGLVSIAENQQEPLAAENYFLDALEKNKGNTTFQFALADIISQWYISRKQAEKVLELAKSLEKQHPDNIKSRTFLVKAQLLNKQTKQAKQILKSIILADKNDVKNRILLAQIISQETDGSNEALSILSNAQAVAPDNIDIYNQKIKILISRKQFDKALSIAETAKARMPDSVEASLLEANIYYAQKHLDKALAIYQQIYKQKPSRKLLSISVDILITLKQNDKAISMLLEAINNDPLNTDSLFKLASLYQAANNLKKAEQYYRQLLKISPDHILALNNLAWIVLEHNIKEAIQLAKKAHNLVPDAAEFADTYGYILLQNKQYQQGLKLLQQAAVPNPGNYDIQYHLALAYEKTAQHKKAKDILKRIIETKKDFSERNNAKSLYQKIR